MANYEESQIHCNTCQRLVLARRRAPNHLVHALATLFLCGLWLPVWIIVSLKTELWRCSVCGGAADVYART